MGRTRCILAMVVLLASLALPLATPVAAGPGDEVTQVTVSPDTGLVDGQRVQVSGTAEQGISGIRLCARRLGEAGCDQTTTKVVFGRRFNVPYRVPALLHTDAGDIDCRTYAPGCRLIAGLGLGNAARANLAFDPEGPLVPAPEVDAQPASQLVDGQDVEVTASGVQPVRVEIRVRECPVGAVEEPVEAGHAGEGAVLPPSPCELLALPDVDPQHHVTATVDIHAVIGTEGMTTDCRVAACELRVTSWRDRFGATPLSFDPDGPLSPGPVLTVSPHSGLRGGQTVDVAISGASPDARIEVGECSLPVLGEGLPCEAPGPDLFTDASGAAETTLVARRFLDGEEGRIDCRASLCFVSIIDTALRPDDEHRTRAKRLAFATATAP